jgi:small subunit ribosomal protein S5
MMEAAGVHDVFTKAYGTNNPHNVVKATIHALSKVKQAGEVAKLRGKTLEELSLVGSV